MVCIRQCTFPTPAGVDQFGVWQMLGSHEAIGLRYDREGTGHWTDVKTDGVGGATSFHLVLSGVHSETENRIPSEEVTR